MGYSFVSLVGQSLEAVIDMLETVYSINSSLEDIYLLSTPKSQNNAETLKVSLHKKYPSVNIEIRQHTTNLDYIRQIAEEIISEVRIKNQELIFNTNAGLAFVVSVLVLEFCKSRIKSYLFSDSEGNKCLV